MIFDEIIKFSESVFEQDIKRSIVIWDKEHQYGVEEIPEDSNKQLLDSPLDVKFLIGVEKRKKGPLFKRIWFFPSIFEGPTMHGWKIFLKNGLFFPEDRYTMDKNMQYEVEWLKIEKNVKKNTTTVELRLLLHKKGKYVVIQNFDPTDAKDYSKFKGLIEKNKIKHHKADRGGFNGLKRLYTALYHGFLGLVLEMAPELGWDLHQYEKKSETEIRPKEDLLTDRTFFQKSKIHNQHEAFEKSAETVFTKMGFDEEIDPTLKNPFEGLDESEKKKIIHKKPY